MAERKSDAPGGPTFLRRWSQRKLAAAREAAPPAPAAGAAAAPAVAPVPQAPAAEAAAPATPEPAPAALPSVDSLTFESDFRAFLGPKVEEGTRRAALRKLFSDPSFNVMDGLDVYIDDYTKFEPMTPEVLKQLAHARYIFDPPRTRVNEQGYVEDVVDEPPPDEAPQAEGPPEGASEATTTEGTPTPAAEAPATVSGAEPAAEASPPAGVDADPAPPARAPGVRATTPAR